MVYTLDQIGKNAWEMVKACMSVTQAISYAEICKRLGNVSRTRVLCALRYADRQGFIKETVEHYVYAWPRTGETRQRGRNMYTLREDKGKQDQTKV